MVYIVEEIRIRAMAVTRAWDRLARCEDEFGTEQPSHCGEYAEALDIAILDLMRFVDPERFIERQQRLSAAQPTEQLPREADRCSGCPHPSHFAEDCSFCQGPSNCRAGEPMPAEVGRGESG